MPIDPRALGYETPPIAFRYGWREVVTYALGVGARPDAELAFLFEGRGPKVLPTFATVPTFAAFDALVDAIGCDRRGMVHHSQRLEIFEPFDPEALLEVRGKITGLYDLKRLAMSVFDIEAYQDGRRLSRGVVTLLLRNDGGFGGERPPRVERHAPPDREPDFEVREHVPDTQALLYRLCGDTNPLHADPAFAAQAGFERPILHGLCTFGYMGRAVLHAWCGGDPTLLRTIRGQFSAPVYPGDTLIIRGWRAEPHPVLQVSTEERPDEVSMSHAFVELG